VLTPLGIQSIVGPYRAGEVPRVNQNVAGQIRHQLVRIQLCCPAGFEGLCQRVVGHLPSHLRIFSWPVGLQSQGTQEKHVVKTDNVL